MSVFNLGVVAPTHKGVYNASTAYKARNIVTYNGGSYMAKQDCQGVSPENASYWGMIAEKGNTPIVYNGSFSALKSDTSIDKTQIYLIGNESDSNYFEHIVFWNGTAWVDGGDYQAIKIQDSSITLNKLDNATQKSWYETYKQKEVALIEGWYDKTGGFHTDTNWGSGKASVTAGSIIYIGTQWDATYQPTYLFLDAENNVLSCEYVKGTNNVTNEKITVPNGATTIIVNKMTQTTIPYVLEVDKNVVFDYSLNEMLKSGFKEEYKDVTYITAENWIFSTDNQVSVNTDYCFAIRNVLPFEKYKFTTAMGADKPCYIVFDKKGNILDRVTQSDWENMDYEITIPDSGNMLVVVVNKNNNFILKKSSKILTNTEIEVEELMKQHAFLNKLSSNLVFENENLKNRVIEEQLKNDFKWASFAGTKYATFTFDDSNSDIDLIEDLFESKEVPCCYATIPNKLNNVCTNGETVKEVLQRAIEHGGEVLAHWQSPLTSSSTDEDYKNVYVGAKKTLEEAGFEVNGIITAGGTDYANQDFVKDTELARLLYKYADLTSYRFMEPKPEQYLNMRFFLNSGLEATKMYVDNYIAGNGNLSHYSRWMNFASHGTSESTISELEQIIDYCIEQGVQIVTWKTIYDTFKSSKLEERIKQLEN